MEDKVTYMIDKDEINQQKMHLTITTDAHNIYGNHRKLPNGKSSGSFLKYSRNMFNRIERVFVRWYNVSVGGLCTMFLPKGQKHDV